MGRPARVRNARLAADVLRARLGGELGDAPGRAHAFQAGAVHHRDARRVVDVAQVIRLGLRAEPARLHLDEIADVHLFGEARSRPQPGVGSHPAALADLRFFQVREREHLAAGADAHVAQHTVRADAHPFAEAHTSFEYAVDVDRDVALAIELAAHVDARRIGEADAGFHQPLRLL